MKDITNKKSKTKKFIFKIAIVLISILVIILGFLLLSYWQSQPSKEIKGQCQVETNNYQNRNVYVVSPKQTQKSNKVVLYVHGGSYVGDLVKEHWEFIRDMVLDTGYTIIVPDYPLAPQNNYQDVFAFMEPLYQEIIKKVDAKNFVMMGDSAGGGLSLALAQRMGEENIEQPAKLILLSPWLDVTLSNPKIQEIEKVDKSLSVVSLKAAAIAYAGKDGMKEYVVNPIKGPLEKLKNVVIYTGTHDILNPDAHVLVERAKNNGITIELKETQGAKHVWMLERHRGTYQAEEGYRQVIQEIKDVNNEEF